MGENGVRQDKKWNIGGFKNTFLLIEFDGKA